MLSGSQFSVLNYCRLNPGATQRAIAEKSGLSLGVVNGSLKELQQMELIDESSAITERGMKALAPYKVDNAIIMAAGLSSRFAPISYEKPKGVLSVRGEVLIERQIRQLREAGVEDITIVLGYKKEEFFYLEDLLGVHIVINPEYNTRNNNSTIRKIQHLLGNTYICSSDNYFTENPFEEYVYESYYSAAFAEGETDEWCLITKGKNNLITGATVGGENSWIMLGHVYWDRSFSATFSRILDEVYDKPETTGKLWEEIYIEHVDQLPMVMRKYPAGVIWEFDNLAELRDFDPEFIDNVDSSILDNICSVLKCKRGDVRDITPIKQGLTNLSFRFFVGDDEREYVYRHPGPGSDEITNRRAEATAEQIVSAAGIDGTFIYEDPETGWKLSYYFDGCRPVEYHDWDDVALAMKLANKLHSLDADCGYDFDVHADTMHTLKLLKGHKQTSMFRDFDELLEKAERFNELAKAHGARKVLCHNDFYPPNFLIDKDGGVQLIDWEYTGMSDYASDLAVFICCCEDYSYEDSVRIFELYNNGPMEPEDLFHCVAFSCVVAFHWLVWALYQDAFSEPVGDLLYFYYRYTKMFAEEADKLAEQLGL